MPSLDALPKTIRTEAELDELMACPGAELIETMKRLAGDIAILGIAGKMGLSLGTLAVNAIKAAGLRKQVYGVSRFSDPTAIAALEKAGVVPIRCDLLDRTATSALPKVPNIVFMAGRKFGTVGEEALTWAMNTHVPALVAETFRSSRIVSFSTACVYPFVPVISQGADESSALSPPGEYANSCVGRERMFEYFSQLHNTPGRLFRLSYAIDLRYGVLADVALKIWRDESVDVTMGHVNVIWQGDANAQALRCLSVATVPTTPLNVSGPETTSIRWLAQEFARRFNKTARITGEEATTAWLMNTGQAERLFGYPKVPLSRQIGWVADWISREQRLYGKPTKFEARDGKY